MTRPSTADDPLDPMRRTTMVTPAASSADTTVESALRDALDQHGPSMIFEPTRLRALLEERCPHARHDVASALKGVDAQVPQALVSTHDGVKLRKLARLLEKKLRDQYAMNRYAAAWTVRTWADALGLDGLATASDDAAAPASASAAQASGPDDRPSTASAAKRDAAAPSVEPARTIASSTDGRPSIAERPPKPRPWARAVLALGFVAAAVAMFRYVNEPPPVDDRTSVSGRVAQARAETGRGDPVASTITTTPAVTTDGPSAGSTPPVASTMSAASAPATSLVELPEIVDVASSEALIGDGRQRELLVVLRTPHADIEHVESRFVSGDPALTTRPTVIAVTRLAKRDERVPAGLIGVKTSRPVRASFEYVVTTVDGRRSAPFVKELVVAAGPPAPPASAVAASRILACRPGMCGTVVGVHQVAIEASTLTTRVENAFGLRVDRPPASSRRRYDVVVRFDDSDVRTLHSDTRFTVGARVRTVGSDEHLAALASER